MPVVSVKIELDQTVNAADVERVGTTLLYTMDSGNGPVESNVEAAGTSNLYQGNSLNQVGNRAASREDIRSRNLRSGELFIP